MRHHGPSSFFSPWIHPSSPYGHERQRDGGLDTTLPKRIASYGKPKGRLCPLFAWWSKRRASGFDKTPGNDADDDDIRMVTGSEEFSYDAAADDDEIRMVTGPKEFSYDELVRATENFSTTKRFAEGRSGDAYKGRLASGMAVSVKRFQEFGGSTEECIAEVKSLSRLAHRNLVKLIGWCHELNYYALVFEYTANGTLHDHLLGDSPIPWKARYEVALGLASALCYLHDDAEECVLHKNISSHTVLLDVELNMKLGGFGITRQADLGISSATTAVADTQGCIAPEFCAFGQYTAASDVYSFGVVALEIASGRSSSQYPSTLGHDFLVKWVWRCYEYGILLEASDEKLMGNFDRREMERLMVVGLWCTHCAPARRPQMEKVLRVLQFQVAPPLPVPLDRRAPDRAVQFEEEPADDVTMPYGFSRTPSLSSGCDSACDSDLDDCLR